MARERTTPEHSNSLTDTQENHNLSSAASDEVSWALVMGEGGAGTGNWKHFGSQNASRVLEAAEQWRKEFAGISKPWLCWCVDEDWCWYQQQLVSRCGWTPIVGTDGRAGTPRLIDEAVFVDFNQDLKLPLMWMHFPVEFTHAFTERLAFWHSDCLPPLPVVKEIANQFETLEPNAVMAVDMTRIGLGTRLKRYLKNRPTGYKRFFELVGCTTAAATENQFNSGAGWWRHIAKHPNFQPNRIGHIPHFEHGVGIWYWREFFGGNVQPVAVDVHPYHYSTNNRRYNRTFNKSGRAEGSKHKEMNSSFDLVRIAADLGL